jgi:hypothetical protein
MHGWVRNCNMLRASCQVSSPENPYNPKYIWKYDELLRRKVRVYVTSFRPAAAFCFIPLTWVILIVAVIVFTLFAVWGGTYMMVLPSCADCREMVAWGSNTSGGTSSAATNYGAAVAQARAQGTELPGSPYDRFRYNGFDEFLRHRSYDQFIFTFHDNLSNATGVPPLPEGEACLPTDCAQSPTYLLWGTCWENPAGLPWEGLNPNPNLLS